MKNPGTIRALRTKALALLVVFAVSATAGWGFDAGIGVLAGGATMLTSFMLSGLLAARVSRAVSAGARAGAAAMVVAKLPILMLVIWALLQTFPLLSVVVGGSVVVFAIVIQGGLGMLRISAGGTSARSV